MYPAALPSSSTVISLSDSSEEEYLRCTVIPMGLELLSEADGMWMTCWIAFPCLPTKTIFMRNLGETTNYVLLSAYDMAFYHK